MRRLLLLFLALAALAAAPALAADKIKVGIMGGDAEVLWARAKEIAARDGLDINLVVFSDYLLPNEAL
ncbi:metal ABC transporter substrate-binding protein, partial [Escherichia coli]|nr:metal ABC transporter substrate-binding protein [Escherichia coli]